MRQGMMIMMINYNGEDFNEIIKDKVLVDFYATWCGPCRMLAPLLEKVSSDIKVVKVDVDRYPELARQCGVMSMPTLIIFENGKEIKKNIGFIPEPKLREFINNQKDTVIEIFLFLRNKLYLGWFR